MRTSIALIVAMSACSVKPSPEPDALSGTDAVPSVPVQPSDTPTSARRPDPANLSAGINATGIALQQQLFTDPKQNYVFSPASISVAFGMLASGARGETQSQLYKALHTDASGADAAFGKLITEWNTTSDTAPLSLNVANRIWIDDALDIRDEFLKITTDLYGAGAESVPFHRIGDAARGPINDWVMAQTNDRIKDLLPAGSVDMSTRMVLVNAIYFKADWATAFDPSATQDAAFTTGSGESVQVPTMHRSESTRYAAVDGVTLVSLPYKGDTADFIVVLPDDSDISGLIARMGPETVDDWLSATTQRPVDLALPKFELEATFDSLAGPMSHLGASLAFTSDADLTGISTEGNLSVSDAIHKAFILVDETGTEAAAATGIVVRTLSLGPKEQTSFIVDRPFWFGIRDRASGTLLFTGRVADPRGE